MKIKKNYKLNFKHDIAMGKGNLANLSKSSIEDDFVKERIETIHTTRRMQ